MCASRQPQSQEDGHGVPPGRHFSSLLHQFDHSIKFAGVPGGVLEPEAQPSWKPPLPCSLRTGRQPSIGDGACTALAGFWQLSDRMGF